MGRTVVRQLEPPRTRRSRGGALLILLALVIIFALIGVASAGAFVANHIGNNSSPRHPPATTGTGTNPALAELHRAQLQATAIVRAAQDAGNSIVKADSKQARAQATAVVAAARRQAARAVAPVPTPLPAATSIPSGSAATGLVPTAVPFVGPTVVAPSTGAPVPSLAGVPASWQVVGYDATFGSGPGSAGAISVINRGARAFSGVATVVYTGGGSASASFASLAPGQSQTLALTGPPYPGHGYHIVLHGLH